MIMVVAAAVMLGERTSTEPLTTKPLCTQMLELLQPLKLKLCLGLRFSWL